MLQAVEVDADGDALLNLDEVAGGVVGGNGGETRTRGSGNLGDVALIDVPVQTVEVADGLEHERLFADCLQGGDKGSRLRPHYCYLYPIVCHNHLLLGRNFVRNLRRFQCPPPPRDNEHEQREGETEPERPARHLLDGQEGGLEAHHGVGVAG